MKICFFNSVKTWGGGEKWHSDIAQAFSQEKHDVCVVSSKNSELLNRARARGIKVKSFSIGNMSFLNPLKIISLYLFFKREKFDVLIMNLSKDLKIAAPVAKLAKISKIVYRRGKIKIIYNGIDTKVSIKKNKEKKFFFKKRCIFVA